MKLLFACADATDTEAVLADLQRAGLPPTVHVVVLSVADLLPVPAGSATTPAPAAIRRARERITRALEQARQTAETAAAQMRAAFPAWTVTAEAEADAPAWAIVRKADALRPDLTVVYAHHDSPLRRVLLGSVAQSVVVQARGSVRIVRRSQAAPDAAQRLLLGIDGSSDADAAAAAVAARRWLPGSQVRIVTALDAMLASMLELPDDSDDEPAAATRLAERAAGPLRAAGLEVAIEVVEGSPKQVLVERADEWRADCVFLGARGRAAPVFPLGSVSATIAARAPCSVEIVRP